MTNHPMTNKMAHYIDRIDPAFAAEVIESLPTMTAAWHDPKIPRDQRSAAGMMMAIGAELLAARQRQNAVLDELDNDYRRELGEIEDRLIAEGRLADRHEGTAGNGE